jgi:hypothetical protein
MFENTRNIQTLAVTSATDGEDLTTTLNRVMANLNAILDETIVVACTPATLGTACTPASTDFDRDVTVTVKNSLGEYLNYNGSLGVAATETTAGSGTSAIADSATTMDFVNGVGTVNVVYTGVFAPGDTQTLTVSGSIAGKTVSATSVDTIISG